MFISNVEISHSNGGLLLLVGQFLRKGSKRSSYYGVSVACNGPVQSGLSGTSRDLVEYAGREESTSARFVT